MRGKTDDKMIGKGGAGAEGLVKGSERWMTEAWGRDKGWLEKTEQGI